MSVVVCNNMYAMRKDGSQLRIILSQRWHLLTVEVLCVDCL